MRKACVRFGSAWSQSINTPEETMCVRPETCMNEHRTKVTIIQMHTHPLTHTEHEVVCGIHGCILYV